MKNNKIITLLQNISLTFEVLNDELEVASVSSTGEKNYFKIKKDKLLKEIEDILLFLNKVYPIYPELELMINNKHFYATDLITGKNEYFVSLFILNKQYIYLNKSEVLSLRSYVDICN